MFNRKVIRDDYSGVMGQIKRVPFDQSGVPDGISAFFKGVHTNFLGYGKARRVGKQKMIQIAVTGSDILGIISFRNIEEDTMITVNLKDMAAVMKEIFDAAQQKESEGIKCPDTETIIEEALEPAKPAEEE